MKKSITYNVGIDVGGPAGSRCAFRAYELNQAHPPLSHISDRVLALAGVASRALARADSRAGPRALCNARAHTHVHAGAREKISGELHNHCRGERTGLMHQLGGVSHGTRD